jgi:hypothetical protein
VSDPVAVVDASAPVVTVRVVEGSDGATLVPVPVVVCREARAELSTLSALVVAGAVVVVSVPATAELETPAAAVVDPAVAVRDSRAELKTLSALVVAGEVEPADTGTTATPVPDVAGDAAPEAAEVALPATTEPPLSVRVMVATTAVCPVNAGSVMLVT